MPPFGPPIPDGAMFPKSADFAEFLLTKGKYPLNVKKLKNYRWSAIGFNLVCFARWSKEVNSYMQGFPHSCFLMAYLCCRTGTRIPIQVWISVLKMGTVVIGNLSPNQNSNRSL